MNGELLTIILPALVAAVATPLGAWIGRKVERQKYEIELGKLRAELKQQVAAVKGSELENVRKASDILMESIVPPLKAEIENLRNDVQRLNKALERIWGCPHVDHCPVKFELLLQPKGSDKRRAPGNRNHHSDHRPRGEPSDGLAEDGADHCPDN